MNLKSKLKKMLTPYTIAVTLSLHLMLLLKTYLAYLVLALGLIFTTNLVAVEQFTMASGSNVHSLMPLLLNFISVFSFQDKSLGCTFL